MKSYETYRDELAQSLSALPPREQYFFGCWCVDYLFSAFASEKVKKISDAEREQIRYATEFMWNILTDFPAYNKRELYDIFSTIERIDRKKFNQDKHSEYAAKCVLVALQLVLAFLEEKAADLIVDAAEVLIQEKESGIIHLFGHDTPQLFDHPLIQHELDQQQRLIQWLSDGPVVSLGDRLIFRP